MLRYNSDYYQVHRIYSRLTSRKASLFESWCLFKRKVCFYHPFWYEERQERGNHELLVSLRRPGSAEQAQLFSVFRSNGGKREATVKRESRSRGVKKTCAPENRRSFLRFSDKQRQEGSDHEEWVTHGRRSTKKRKAKPAVPCTYTNFSSYCFPRHRRRLQQTWFYVEATFSLKKWRLQVNICFYASETYKKVIYLNVNKSLRLFWCFHERFTWIRPETHPEACIVILIIIWPVWTDAPFFYMQVHPI